MRKFVVNVNGNRYEVEVEEVQGDFSEVAVETTTKAVPTKKEVSSSKKILRKGEEVKCPMPCNILSVDVTAGDIVKMGDTLVVLEAMKMENEIKAPRDGKILDIGVSKGNKVNTGDVLVVLE